MFSAILFKLSAAINVCAIPVGHAVTAKTLGYLLASFSLVSIIFFSVTFSSWYSSLNFSLSFLSIISLNSFSELEFISLFLKSSSISIVDNLDNTSRWVLLAPSGAAIIKNRFDKLPSNDS